MYPCKSCKENNWQYSFTDDGWITAECKNCTKVLRFPSARKKKILSGNAIGTGAKVEFKMINKQMCRKERNGWYTTGFIKVKQGIRLAAIDLMESF